MATYTYPTSVALKALDRVRTPRQQANRLGFQLVPTVDLNASKLRWTQQDDYYGLQAVRGLNGEPTRVKRVGAKAYEMSPGAYGEFIRIDEEELTNRANGVNDLTPININDLVTNAQEQLGGREVDRQEVIIWLLLMNGTFAVTDPFGRVLHTDTYMPQQYTASITWNNLATATPLADLRAMQPLQRGKGVNFGVGAVVYMNQQQATWMLQNANASDFGGRKGTGTSQIQGLTALNTFLAGEGLPRVEVYDETYQDDTNTAVNYISDHKLLLWGQRPAGQRIAEYQLTRNVNNPNNAPGGYTKVIDRGEDTVPRSIEVHKGHNGGPVVYYPGSMVLGNV